MFLALLKLSPVFLSLTQLVLYKILVATRAGWQWYLILILGLDLAYFILLKIKLKPEHLVWLALHSLIVVTSGFAFLLITHDWLFVNAFIVSWSLVYFFYLESIFHYYYESRKQVLFNIQNVISYTNLIAFFLINATLYNFYIFIEIGWWWILIINLIASYILLINYYLVNQVNWQDLLVYSSVIVLIILEVVAGLIFWPVSFYVLTLIVTLSYYVLSSLSLLYWQEKLTAIHIWQYTGFTLIILGLVLLTTIWL